MTPLLDPDRALALVLENAPFPRAQQVDLEAAAGRILAAPVLAVVDQPPFTKSMMDGFAVVTADAGCTVACVDEVAAGASGREPVARGRAVAIMTGAPCPPGTEAVVKVEDTERLGEDERAQVRLPQAITPGQHTQPQGILCRAGDEVLPAGTALTSAALAAAAAVGSGEVTVAARPSVAIITTGNELGRPGDALIAAQIYDSNGPMLSAQARLAGAGLCSRHHARDEQEALGSVLEEVAGADFVVLSGGVSMGRYDLVPKVVAALGAETIFHKIAQKPGKPLLFARRGDQLIFGLPGTPLGSHLGFHRYVAAAIRQASGRSPVRTRHTGRLEQELHTRGSRTLFRLARAFRYAGQWIIDPLQWGGSSDMVGPGRATCYLRFPPGEHHHAPGDELGFELIDGVTETGHC